MPSSPALVFGLAMLCCWLGAMPPARTAAPTADAPRLVPLTVPAAGHTGFTEMAPTSTGILFTNRLANERSITNQVFLNGSGVAAGDVDGDGRVDLYFCGLDSRNALYRNLGGWKFTDITTEAGVACADQASTGAAFADLDGDGDLDLLVNGIAHGTRLFLNDGAGRFREASAHSGLARTAASHSLAIADVDGDGLLDVYVVNYRNDTMRDLPDLRFRFGVTNGVSRLLSVNGRSASEPDLAGRFSFDQASGVLENGEPDVLYRNLGQGRFAAVPWNSGAFLDEAGARVQPPHDWGLSAMFRDLDGDGAPDLYVCNDFQSPDRIWLNDGHGVFRALPRAAIRQTSLFSMGVDFADLDRDGRDEIFVADMLSREHERRLVQVMDATAFAQFRRSTADRPQTTRNTLFRDRGDGTYAEIARFAGLEASEWTWCPAFLDVDLDGYEDLLVTTGHERDAQHADLAREIERERGRRTLSHREQLDLRRRFPRLDTPNLAFRNRGDLTFEESGAAWGFASRRVSQGMALADLDGDGDLDAIVNCLGDGPWIGRNETPRPRLAVRLEAAGANRRGIGARIRIIAPDLPVQSQEMTAGGRYLSSDDPARTFAVKRSNDLVQVEVTWRNGRRSSRTNVPANHLVVVRESDGAGPAAPPRIAAPGAPASGVWFEDRTAVLAHRHVDEGPDEFARHPLLPHALDHEGPGVAWFDFNGDGWEDLLVGAGRGGRPGVFRNDGKGGFIRQRSSLFESPVDHDLDTILGWRLGNSESALLLARSDDAGATNRRSAIRVLSLATGATTELALPHAALPGPLAMADVDGDGDLDLFVGGRPGADRYPRGGGSILFRNDEGRLVPATEATGALDGLGRATGAVFTDLDADGHPDLVVSCEWGPVTILRNEKGTLRTWEPALVWPSAPPSQVGARLLSELTGWWTAVVAGDFDGDGRTDLVAGNWGRNTSRQPHLVAPIKLFHADLDGGGREALLEAWFDPRVASYVPARDWGTLTSAFPMFQARYAGFAAFARARLDELLRADLPPLQEVTARTLDSLLLLNRGDRFEVRPLPFEAQLSPVFGLAVGDLDGDGAEDLVFTQNAYDISPSESRHDSGIGGWLRGDGRGGFIPVPASESSLRIDGEGRGLALCDFDHDGRLDVAAGQHRGETRLWRNRLARPGIRVALHGGPSNPQAIGARLRLQYAGGNVGPVHEVQAGGGHRSQNAAVLVLAHGSGASVVQIDWPNGAKELVPVQDATDSLSRAQPIRR